MKKIRDQDKKKGALIKEKAALAKEKDAYLEICLEQICDLAARAEEIRAKKTERVLTGCLEGKEREILELQLAPGFCNIRLKDGNRISNITFLKRQMCCDFMPQEITPETMRIIIDFLKGILEKN